MKCRYCEKPLERKEYPGGSHESNERLAARIYCDSECYYLGRAYEHARNKYKVLKNEREVFIKLSRL